MKCLVFLIIFFIIQIQYPVLAEKSNIRLVLEYLKSYKDFLYEKSFLANQKFYQYNYEKRYPNQYSINLMWINRQASEDQVYIYPSNNNNNFGKHFLDTTLTWAKENPECTVNLWFDSLLTVKESIENTQSCINQEIAKYGRKIAKIKLMDIRQLARVKKNPSIFSPEIPVYFRVDLLRAIASEEITEQNKNLHFVYTDFDIKPISKEQLFNKKTLENLNKHNFVMAEEANDLGFENSFQIFTYNEKLSKAMKLMVIKANILRAQSFLEDIKEKSEDNSFWSSSKAWKIHEVSFQENVFYSYPLMYAYFCQLQNISKLTLPGSDTPYDKINDGKEVLNRNAKLLLLQSSANPHFSMPTKKISIPPTTSLFNEISSNF